MHHYSYHTQNDPWSCHRSPMPHFSNIVSIGKIIMSEVKIPGVICTATIFIQEGNPNTRVCT